MGKEIAIQVQEDQRLPYRINPRRITSRHILIKLTKINSKLNSNKKCSKGKAKIIYKEIPIKALQVRRGKQDTFSDEKNIQPRLLYPARISFRFVTEIGSFTDKQKLREFNPTKPA